MPPIRSFARFTVNIIMRHVAIKKPSPDVIHQVDPELVATTYKYPGSDKRDKRMKRKGSSEETWIAWTFHCPHRVI